MSVPAQRDPNGRWLPGFAPNPTGRPAAVKEVRDLARQHTPAAIARLAELMNDNNPTVALAAIDQLLNRGYGKPMQAVDVETRTYDMSQLYLLAAQRANADAHLRDQQIVDVTPSALAPSAADAPVSEIESSTSSETDC